MTGGIQELANLLRRSQHPVVLTGAGVSAESGVPTFRDTQTGLWANYRPEDLATPEAFTRDPETVWRWYAWRRELLAGVRPNPGHTALARLQQVVPALALITQNVDGLHQLAGSPGVIEFHGNINRTVCSDKSCQGQALPDDTREPPLCDRCAALMRPDVVWFGEAIPEPTMTAAGAALEGCDLFISIGTSAVVYPAAGMAQQVVANGANVAEINPNATPLTSNADISIAEASGEVLPKLLAAIET